MAGGAHGQIVMCLTCMMAKEVVAAHRYSEGIETDWYRCEKGHEMGIDWSRSGPPSESQWPPSEEALACLDKM